VTPDTGVDDGTTGVAVEMGVAVLITVGIAVDVLIGTTVDVGTIAVVVTTRSLKLVSQPFELSRVTVVHVPVHAVSIVASAPTAKLICLVGWPAQLKLMLLAAPPPL
jgi:hypothetical protein